MKRCHLILLSFFLLAGCASSEKGLQPIEDHQVSTEEVVTPRKEVTYKEVSNSMEYSVLQRPEVPPELTNALLRVEPGGPIGHVDEIAVFPDGKRIVAGGLDKTIRFFDLKNGEQTGKILSEGDLTGTLGQIESVALSPDGKELAVGGKFPGIRIYDATTEKLNQVITGPVSAVETMQFSSDGQYLAVGFSDGKGGGILVFTVTNGYQCYCEFRSEKISVFDLDLYQDEDEHRIAAVDALNSTALLYSIDRQSLISTYQTDGQCRGIDVGAKYIAAADSKDRILLFDKELNPVKQVKLENERSKLFDVLFTGDGKYLIAADGAPYSCYVYDTENFQKVSQFSLHEGSVMAIHEPGDGTALSAGVEGRIYQWDLLTGELVQEIGRGSRPVRSIGVDGGRIYFGHNTAGTDGTGGDDVFAGYLTPEQLVGVFDDFVIPDTFSLQPSRDGINAVIEGGYEVFLSGEGIDTISIRPGGGISSIGIHSGNRVICGGWDGLIWVYNTKGEMLIQLSGHEGAVFGFSEYKGYLVSCGDDRTIRFWDIKEVTEDPTGEGAFIVQEVIPGKAGERAGLKVGDVIISLNGIRFSDTRSFAEYIRKQEKCRIELIRNGNEMVLEASKKPEEMYAFYFGRAVPTMKPALSFYLSEKDGLIAWTPEGAFEGTMGAGRHIGFQIDRGMLYESEWLSLRDLSAVYYYPGLVSDFFNGRAIDAPPGIDTFPLPPGLFADTIEQKEDRALVKVSAENRGGGVERLRVYRNNRVVEPEITQTGRSERGVEYELDVPLSDGVNDILVSAETGEGLRSFSNTLRLETELTNDTEPELYLLVCGVDTYSSSLSRNEERGLLLEPTGSEPDSTFPSLQYAVKDARDMVSGLRGTAPGAFSTIHETVLFDQDATVQGIGEAFHRMYERADSNDRVLIYFAGHGSTIGKEYYFVPYGVKHVSELSEKGLAANTITEWISRTRANEVFLLLDTCQSGATAATLAKSLFGSIQLLGDTTGIWVMASSASTEASLESDRLENGLFTYSLLSVLKDSLSEPGNLSFQDAAKRTEETMKDVIERFSGNPEARQTMMYTREMDTIFSR